LDSKKLGRDIETRIHGVFDLANIQSLAQLLGVVVERHLSGRGTAFVGLGSSSYSNGNRCYEILKQSMESNGAFRGKETFHPATHTVNPFAQALIFAEDIFRAYRHAKAQGRPASGNIRWVMDHIRKPEPAGAAAYAGYLLSRLDSGTLSIVEIAYTLKLVGFSKLHFLEFCNLPKDETGLNKFLQESTEEGQYMGDLARNILLMLDWPLSDLERRAEVERNYSQLKYKLYPLDDVKVELLNPQINIYLTGDNTFQPSEEFVAYILSQIEKNEATIDKLIGLGRQALNGKSGDQMINLTGKVLIGVSDRLKSLDSRVNKLMKRSVNKMVEHKVRQISGRQP
jgi:hypothetical protein